mmetsp:Transcript_1750/g.4020  ORF Transcript_1750/g.4020 Transcript_1750/m.4020 type:complete len:123 (+) Transcript_1750:201-569(+)
MITNKRKRCRAVPTALDDFVNIPKLMNGMLKQKRTSEMCSRRWGAILSISERRGGMENFSSYSGGDSIEPSRNSSGNSSNNNNTSSIMPSKKTSMLLNLHLEINSNSCNRRNYSRCTNNQIS